MDADEILRAHMARLDRIDGLLASRRPAAKPSVEALIAQRLRTALAADDRMPPHVRKLMQRRHHDITHNNKED